MLIIAPRRTSGFGSSQNQGLFHLYNQYLFGSNEICLETWNCQVYQTIVYTIHLLHKNSPLPVHAFSGYTGNKEDDTAILRFIFSQNCRAYS